MTKALHWPGRVVALAAFAAVVGYFADSPAFVHLPPDQALIKLSFAHNGQRKEKCQQLTKEEMAKLPPNMRKTEKCPRERLPVLTELWIDGERVLSELGRPAGLSRDSASRFYHTYPVLAGEHRIEVRVRDSHRTEGFDHEGATTVTLAPAQVFVVDFRQGQGGFLFK